MKIKNRNCYVIILALALLSAGFVGARSSNPKYDKALADSLGADDYGMMYVLVLLKTGPVKIDDKKTTDSLFAGHFKNIGRLANEGKLSVSRPFKKTKRITGEYLFLM